MKKAKQLAIAITISCFFLSCEKEPSDGTETNNNSELSEELNQELLLSLVNTTRSEGCNCGDENMPPVDVLVWNDLLETAAANHSIDMNEQNYFDHQSKDGSSPGDRITSAGYVWSTYGENIANGYSNEEAVINGWLNSPGHCKNIMNASFTEMGVGKSGTYWTQVFGAQ